MHLKQLALGSLVALSTALITFSILPTKTPLEVDALQHPGWYDYILELKGEVPRALVSQWYLADEANKIKTKKAYNSLENIVEMGPTNVGGRTRSIAIDYGNPNHLLCAGISGGIWASYNNGASWEPINDTAATMSATTITQSPFDHDVFYYGTGEALGNSADIYGLGIFKSTNNGKSFQLLPHTVTGAFDEVWDIEHSLVFDSTIYVATDQDGLWMSKDAGASFQKIYNTSKRMQEIAVFSDSTLVIAVDGYGLVRIDERTLENTRLNGPGWPTSGYSRISFDYCDSFPNVMYAHAVNGSNNALAYTLKTSDGGLTWQSTNEPTTSNGYNFAWYCFKVSVAPADSNLVLSTSVRPYYSRDGGNTWFAMANPHVDYHEITWYNNNEFLVGNDGGVHRFNISDLSTSVNLNNGLNITQFYAGAYAPSGNTIIGGTQDNGTRYSINGNPIFSRVYGGDGSYCAINQQDAGVRYVSYQNLNMFRQEGGNNFSISQGIRAQVGGDAGVWFINPYTVNDLDGQQVFVPTKRQIFRSLNSGNNWSIMTNDLIGDSYSIGLSNSASPTAYIGGTGSRLYRVDNALTAQPGDEVDLFTTDYLLFFGGTIGCIEVDPYDEGTIYVGMVNYTNSFRPKIWKIVDADTDNPIYYDISNNLPENMPVNWIEVDPQNRNHIYIGTDYGLYSSLSGGASWQKEYRIPNVPIDMIKLRTSDRKLFVYTHGRGVWSADLLEDQVTSVQSKEMEVSVYPNPASTVIHIKTAQSAALALYDNQGLLVRNGFGNQLNVANLPRGIYFLEVSTDKGLEVKKVLLK
jgi:hypothetical protein